jgi:hypothetical protein
MQKIPILTTSSLCFLKGALTTINYIYTMIHINELEIKYTTEYTPYLQACSQSYLRTKMCPTYVLEHILVLKGHSHRFSFQCTINVFLIIRQNAGVI